MNDSINLVTADTRENLKRKKRTYVLRIISIVFLVFVGLVSIILFILNSSLSLSSVKKQEVATIQSISLQKDKLAKFNLLNDRLKSIKDVLKDRKNYTNTLNVLLDQIPQGVGTSSLNIEKSDVTLTINAVSLLPINKFLNNVIELSSKKKVIKDMVIESLSIDSKTGIYSLSIKAKL